MPDCISNVFDALIALRRDVADGAKTDGNSLFLSDHASAASRFSWWAIKRQTFTSSMSRGLTLITGLSSTHESRLSTRRAVSASPHNSMKPQSRHICADAGTSPENSENNGLSLSRNAIGAFRRLVVIAMPLRGKMVLRNDGARRHFAATARTLGIVHLRLFAGRPIGTSRATGNVSSSTFWRTMSVKFIFVAVLRFGIPTAMSE